ncbi:unnamed protein product [Pylaiella littoralis]
MIGEQEVTRKAAGAAGERTLAGSSSSSSSRSNMGTTVSHRKVPPLKEPRLQGPAVNGHRYHTRMFVIRYRDEELELGEVVNFQIPVELDAGRRWLEAGQTLVLEMELMFSKLASLETDSNADKATNGVDGGAQKGSGEEEGGSEEEEELNLERVAVQRFEASLSGGHWGLHAYVPVTFSGAHFVRIDCMVHGVLRNLKLEAPKPSPEEASIGMDDSAAAAERPTPRASPLGGTTAAGAAAADSDDGEESLPASLERLGVRAGDGGGAGSAGAAAVTGAAAGAPSSPSRPPKYDWFALYDEQGVGGRRVSAPHVDRSRGSSSSSSSSSSAAGGSKAAEGGPRAAASNGNNGGADSEVHGSNQSSGRAEGSWRWGWGRKGTSSRSFASNAVAATSPEEETGATAETKAGAAAAGTAATSSPVTTVEERTATGPRATVTQGDRTELSGGGEDHDCEREDGPQKLGVSSTLEGVSSSGDGAEGGPESGRTLARGVDRERQMLRRKDVYSYFMMPLMRALEAQMGTTAWLRKLLEADSSEAIPPSAAPLWLPADPSCEADLTRVLRRLFVSSVDIANSEDGHQQGQQQQQQQQQQSRRPTDGEGDRLPPPPAAGVAFPALIARYCKGWDRCREGQGLGWLRCDEATCAALELDVHALAMLIFVEWREFVSALPGCGAVLSKETSALWFAQIRQRWACQATLHTCSAAAQRPSRNQGGTVTASGTRPPSTPAFDSSGRPAKVPASGLGAPLLSRLEPEIAEEHFGAAVRMACADASAPYKLPLQDKHMFPDGDAALPVCLVQRYENRQEEEDDDDDDVERMLAAKGRRTGASFSGSAVVVDRRSGSGSAQGAAAVNKGRLVVAGRSPPLSPVWVSSPNPAAGPASTLPAEVEADSSSPSPPLLRNLPSKTAAAAAPLRVPQHARAASASARAGEAVGYLDIATASAAVAAAVAAAASLTSTDEDRSRSPSSRPPAAAQQRSGRVVRRSRSLSPASTRMAEAASTSAAAAGGGVEAAEAEAKTGTGSGAGVGERRGPFKKMSPLRIKGRGFFSPSRSRWPSSLRSPGRKRGAEAASAGDNGRSRAGGDDAQPGGEPEDAAGGTADRNRGRKSGYSEGSNESTDSRSAGLGGDDDREGETLPPPPPPPSQYNTPPPTIQQRRGSDGTKGFAPSPLRRTPVASPARPPLKPMMAAEQPQQQQKQQQQEGKGQGQGQTAGADSGTSRTRRDKNDRASLLDGVEQSSDLGAFFRQGNWGGRGGGGGGGRGGRRRGRRASPRTTSSGRRGVPPRSGTSPRARTGELRRLPLRRGDSAAGSSSSGGGSRKDQDEDDEDGEDEEDGEEEEEEEDIGRGAGVGLHVIVLHHGYCGSSMDMRLIKNYIRILAPKALLLNAESNERDPHASMRVMGENLAKEVLRFLMVRARSLLLPGGQGRLSFIGHSAGAVIMRVALTFPSLLPALDRLHMFVSLGSPHLGTVYGSSGIVRTGMWAMKRWTKSKLLEEMGLTDASRPDDTLLCWLSKQPGLEYFRHVVLVSADKDGYVPPQSARVQMCDASIRDAERQVPHGQVVCEMTKSLLGPINDDSLYRLHLWGGERQANSGGGGMDEYIGRTAHISMMDSPSLVCLLLCTLLDLIL